MNKLQELENKYKELGAEIEKLKQPKFDYPLAFKSKDGQIVLFEDLKKGKVIKVGKTVSFDIGDYLNTWIPHTDSTKWTPVAYDKKRGFYDGQLIYCWNNTNTHRVIVKFYDAINKCSFNYGRSRNGSLFDNYSATMPEFMNKAYDNLEGI